MREGVREVTQNMRPSEINPKLEEAVQNQPLLPHLLSVRPIAIALAAGAVVAAILFFLVAPMVGGIGLLLVFFGTWIGLSARDYAKADEERERKRDDEDDDEDDES
jgi:type IV secretory pathway TrbD component